MISEHEWIRALRKDLDDYEKVVYIDQGTEELFRGIGLFLKKEDSKGKLKKGIKKGQKKYLFLTECREACPPVFDCADVRQMQDREREWLIRLYRTYHFCDNLIFLSDPENLPYPFLFRFVQTGILTTEEAVEALLG